MIKELQDLEKLHAAIDAVVEKTVTVTRSDINYYILPVTKVSMNDENIEKFNAIIEQIHKIKEEYGAFRKIRRTKSGGISKNKNGWTCNQYEVKASGAGVELTVLCDRCFRLQLGNVQTNKNGTKVVSGRTAFNRFRKELAKDGINIEDYATNDPAEAEKINAQIRKPRIKMNYKSKNIDEAPVLEHVMHLDFHKAYMSGLAISHPELRPTIERLYREAKNNYDSSIKSIFTNFIGYCHSKIINRKYVTLARDAINAFNKRFDEVIFDMVKDFKIIGFNTDGVWYQKRNFEEEYIIDPLDNKRKAEAWDHNWDNRYFRSPYFGSELGQFENDYCANKFRAKSDGSYEFVETFMNQYHAVVRGRTELDKVKDRSEWEWGDIFDKRAVVLEYELKDDFIVKRK